MRIVSYNVEWFNQLFDDDGWLINDDGWSGRWDVTRAQQTAALGAVFQALDADAVMVVEAPDNSRKRDAVRALTGFATTFGLRARAALTGFRNDTQQEIALLYDPDVATAVHDPQGDDQFPPFDDTYQMDLNVDAAPDPLRWSKPPLEIALTTAAGPLRLIGVHALSLIHI